MIDDAMIKRLAVQCGSDAVTGEETTVREFFRKFARACYAAGQRDKAEECAAICDGEEARIDGLTDDAVPNGHLYLAGKAVGARRCAVAIRARTEEAKP